MAVGWSASTYEWHSVNLVPTFAFYSVVDDDGSYGRGIEVTILGRVFTATIPIFSDHGGGALAFDVRGPLWSRRRQMWYSAPPVP